MNKSFQDKQLLLEDHSQKINQQSINDFMNYFDIFYGLDFNLQPLYDLLNKGFSTAEKKLIIERIELIYKLEDPYAEFYPKYPTDAAIYCKKLSALLNTDIPILSMEYLNNEEMFDLLFLPEEIIMGFDIDMQPIAFIHVEKENLQTALHMLNAKNELKFRAKITHYKIKDNLAKILLEPKKNHD